MKLCVQINYRARKILIETNKEMLRKLRNLQTPSTFYMITIEQNKKISIIKVDKSKMIKRKITDK